MKNKFRKVRLLLGAMLLLGAAANAQVMILSDYKNFNSPAIGTFQGLNFREAGFSGMFIVPGTNGKEFWICSDRGVNVDAANANPSACRPTYDKIFGFPSYAPKIFRVKIIGDSVQILQTISMKRPSGATATGLINPTGYGSTASEEPSFDTVQDCANYSSKLASKDIYGIDAEGLAVDRTGNFWVCEEGGPTIWKMNPNGVLTNRYTPYATLSGAQPGDLPIDTVFKYRKNNRGFEGITITPSGKIYAIIQSPLLFPTASVGEATRVHRILELNPATGATRMFAYLNDGIIGTGSNQIRLKDWKIGDMVAINDTTFLVMEAALRGTTDIKRVYKINISSATPVTSGLYGGLTLEALVDSTGLASYGITPVRKTLFADLLAAGWDPALEKAEGLSIINDSTIAITNDNDYAQYSIGETGVAMPTTNLSHIVTFRMSGSSRLNNFIPPTMDVSSGVTGINSSQTPYLVPAIPGVVFTSILSAGNDISGYKMVGIPDGAGAFDNGDGTFTMLVNHELGNTVGIARAHGNIGAFVSKWIIDKTTLRVLNGTDLINTVNIWNTATSSYVAYNSAFTSASATISRLCSADLPEVTAFYNARTGKGTMNRIFMNGEETGSEGRSFAHVVTGADAGKSYELPYLGKFSWENALANPTASDTTVVIGTDDATPGQVYVYIGNKTNSGSDIEKAGLTGGNLFAISVAGWSTEVSDSVVRPGTTFSLVSLGDVHNMTGAALNTASNTAGATNFLRPEDGSWDPRNPNDFYFATTNSFTAPSRLWKLHFINATNPTLGGTITAVLDGTEGQKMLDNIAFDNYGHIMLLEDVGNNAHIGKIWEYTIATDSLKLVAAHDTTRFLAGGANYLTQDEESSGMIDAERILGPGMFLMVDQAHYAIGGEIVEGGQILTFYNPGTFNSAPEVAVSGNNIQIVDGDTTPSTADFTHFGSVYTGNTVTKNFVLKNVGAGSLTVNSINFAGTHAGDFTLASAISLPRTLARNDSLVIPVTFAPMIGGSRNGTIIINNTDLNEGAYDFALSGNAIDSPEITVMGNAFTILDGDMTPGTANNTDFGSTTLGTSVNRGYKIINHGNGKLIVSNVSFIGTAAADFSVLSGRIPDTLRVGDTAIIVVRFTPSVEGTRGAQLNIRNNDADEATYDFAIQGSGLGLPEVNVQGNAINILDGDVTPGAANNTDFGGIMVPGGFVNKTFQIQNTGTGALAISSINFTGTHASEFTLYGAPTFPVVIPAGGFQAIVVQFAPTAVGIRTATININNTDADESAYDFTLQGLGVSTLGGLELNATTMIKVYPNPAQDAVKIDANLGKKETLNVEIYDVTGRIVAPATEFNLSAGHNEMSLNTAHLQNGMYILSISNGIGTVRTRLVIAH